MSTLPAPLTALLAEASTAQHVEKVLQRFRSERNFDRVMLSRYEKATKLRRRFEVLKHPDGASTLITKDGWRGGDEGTVEEAMLEVQGVIVAQDLPPITSSTVLPKQMTYAKQSISVCAINNESFTAASRAVREIHRFLATKYQEGALRPYTDADGFTYPPLTFSNRYFTPHKHVHNEPAVPFLFGVDDHGILKEKGMRAGLHLRDNQVGYFAWSEDDSSGAPEIEPAFFRVGHIVNLQVGFGAIPTNQKQNGQFQFVMKLRSITLLDHHLYDLYTELQNIPPPVLVLTTRTPKRRALGYERGRKGCVKVRRVDYSSDDPARMDEDEGEGVQLRDGMREMSLRPSPA